MEGILLVNKTLGKSSFSIVRDLRKITNVKKIGHAGTLDPLATGVMVLLIGKNYTKKSDLFLSCEKKYISSICLGLSSSTYDREGPLKKISDKVPTLEEIENKLSLFQGKIYQTPPIFSAKKVQGKKCYQYARKNLSVERAPVQIQVNLSVIEYRYPYLSLSIECSAGTYIRSLAHDLGNALETGAVLSSLIRVRSGKFYLSECIDQEKLFTEPLIKWIRK